MPVLAQKIVGGINHSTLLAIPFFILAAELMGEGQIAKRLTGFVQSLVGHRRGGMGLHRDRRLDGLRFAVGLGAGDRRRDGPHGLSRNAQVGLQRPLLARTHRLQRGDRAFLIPPSITLIIYGWMTGTSVARLFVAGLAVGIVLGVAFAVLVGLEARRQGIVPREKSSWKERFYAIAPRRVGVGHARHHPRRHLYRFLHPDMRRRPSASSMRSSSNWSVFRSLTLKKLFAVTERAAISTAIIFILLAMGGAPVLLHQRWARCQPESSALPELRRMRVRFTMLLSGQCRLPDRSGMFIDPKSRRF